MNDPFPDFRDFVRLVEANRKQLQRLKIFLPLVVVFCICSLVGSWLAFFLIIQKDYQSLSARVYALQSDLELQKDLKSDLPSPAAAPTAPPQSGVALDSSRVFNDKQLERIRKSVGLLVVGMELSVNLPNGIQKKEFPLSGGSCVIIDSTGHVLTNYHVIADYLKAKPEEAAFAREISAEYRVPVNAYFGMLMYIEGRYYYLKRVFDDKRLDIALLEIVNDAKTPAAWSYLPLASSDAVNNIARGETVLACGYPAESSMVGSVPQLKERIRREKNSILITDSFLKEDFLFTMTAGIVSRPFKDVAGTAFIQHDAIITAGNSGGPLLNTKEEVLGINTLASKSAEGYGLAVSVASIYPEIQKYLDAGKE